MTTKKRVDDELDEQLSTLDKMLEDAEQAEAPQEYPDGAPEFKSLLAVRPRSRRAEFKRLLGQVSERHEASRLAFDEFQKAQKSKDNVRRQKSFFEFTATIDESLEVVERALRIVAVDVEKYDAWAAEASDQDLQVTWAVYQRREQPGEASSSAS